MTLHLTSQANNVGSKLAVDISFGLYEIAPIKQL